MKILNILAISALMTTPAAFAHDIDDKDREWRQNQDRQMEQDNRHSDRSVQSHMNADQHGFVRGTISNAVSADHLIGSSVRTRVGNEEIGELEDILIDRNGKPVAAIIEVGGFLGIGDRDVAISWDRVSVVPETDEGTAMTPAGNTNQRANRATTTTSIHEPDSYVLVVDVTAETLESAPEFDRSWD